MEGIGRCDKLTCSRCWDQCCGTVGHPAACDTSANSSPISCSVFPYSSLLMCPEKCQKMAEGTEPFPPTWRPEREFWAASSHPTQLLFLQLFEGNSQQMEYCLSPIAALSQCHSAFQINKDTFKNSYHYSTYQLINTTVDSSFSLDNATKNTWEIIQYG